MKFNGFIGPAYTLESTNVDAQRCVNMFPVKIESGSGKGAQQYYLKATPGLEELTTIGDGPLRCLHIDAIGRKFVVSGNKLYRFAKNTEWSFNLKTAEAIATSVTQASGIDTGTDIITTTADNFYWTGLKVLFSSSGTMPTGLSTVGYIISVSDSTFKVASSLANAIAGTAIDITAVGSGTMTVTPYTFNNSLFNVPARVQNINNALDVNYSTNVLTVSDSYFSTASANGHFYTGLKLTVYSIGTPLPTGLTQGTDYYAIKLTNTTFQLASSMANASAGTAIDLTEASGTWSAQVVKLNIISSSDAEFQTSTGKVSAASDALGGDKYNSSTLFTDGTYNYILLDDSAQSSTSTDDWPLNPTFFQMGENAEPALFPAGPQSSHIALIDGYFILNEIDTNKFYTTNLADYVIDALNFASSEGSPDKVLGLVGVNRNLWVFNEKTIEVYVNTGNADFPFERIQNAYIEIGLKAKYSIAKLPGTVFWLGRSEQGENIVFMAGGLSPQRISTHAIEYAISTYSDPSTATAYTYQEKGHSFYVINFDEATWCYDLSTGSWHQRAYTNAGTLERHLGQYYVFDYINNQHLVTDYQNNKIYKLNPSKYTDNGDAITRLRSSPHVSADLKRLFCSSFQLDMEVGIGLDGGVQGSSPTVVFDFSDDGGHTWSSESWALADNTAGSIGEYKTRVRWTRLGSFRDRIFRVQMTDPVKTVWIDAQLEVEQGRD